ncbi:MAG: CotH kinase family protein [Deltaproteobacteria bacterium]|nr:CotH kinase family protein [Deltaproteobacteria bacterium]
MGACSDISFFRRCWKWSWIVTLPITAFFAVWLNNTGEMYYLLKLKYRPTMPVSLSNIGSMQAGLLLNEIKGAAGVFNGGKGLDSIHIYARESELKELDSDLPYSGRRYVQAQLLYPEGKLFEVKMKYRGDFSYHWSDKKKSIRIKTKKDRLFGGVREFNLIIPKTRYILNDHIAYRLAKRMGLLAPESRLVEVYVNGKYRGVQIFAEQLGEQFLRRQGKMPGDLYSGDLVGEDMFPVVGTEVFMNPVFWKKAAVNNHNPPEWNEALKELSSAIYNGDMDRVTELLDMEAWARFAAFITITRTPHFDAEHNWRLYFDPAMGKFIPVIWDPLCWNYKDYVPLLDKQTNRMDIITNPVFELLHRDQAFLALKHEAIASFFREGVDDYTLKLLDDTGALETSIRRDRNLHFESSYVLGPGEVIDGIRAFKGLVQKSFDEVKREYMGSDPAASYSIMEKTGGIQINVAGFTPIRSLEINYSPGKGRPLGASVAYLKDGSLHSKDISASILEADGGMLRVSTPLFSKRVMTVPAGNVPIIIRDASVEPASYIFHIKGADKRKVLGVNAVLFDGRKIPLSKTDHPMEVHPLDGTFNILPAIKTDREIVWASDVIINGVKEVNDSLVIRPGVTVRFSSGSALVVRGKLTARGEKDRPIRFVPVEGASGPWGALVLAGKGAGRSSLSHCEFSGGSGLSHRLVEYSAMLSIHGVEGVTIEHCSFADSKVVDDMVHAVYSEVALSDSVFRNSKADALDLDYVKAKVVNSSFINSGNDGLDLMSSTVAVLGSVMEGSGDKGISVGEGTEVFVWNTRISGNQIGLQAKDSSTAVLYNSELLENRKSIDAYKKNWQYGEGGHALVYKSILDGASPAITAGKGSSIRIFDSYLKGDTGGKTKRIKIDSTVDAEAGYERKARSKSAFIWEESLPESVRPYLHLVSPTVRGGM